jgi:hydroxyacylglutathione hydrolase
VFPPHDLAVAAGAKGTMEGSARELFRSLARLKAEPDYLQIWPGHGAGSACGKSLGSMPQSTLGYERLFNWAFGDMSEKEFVAKVLEDQPVPPRYFAAMKRVNRMGAERAISAEPVYAGTEALESALENGEPVIDTRPAVKFAAGHVPGTLNIPLGKSFLNWSGALIPEDHDFYIITEVESDDAVKLILGDLSKVGLGRVRGVFQADVLHEWKSRHGNLEMVTQLDAAHLNELAGRNGLQVVDVRSPEEWSKGHLPGAIHIPLARLPDRIGELDASAPIVLHCKGGGRSSIATSFLQSRGLTKVSNLAGGFDAWVARGFEIDAGKSAPTSGGRKSAPASRGRKSAQSSRGRKSARSSSGRKPSLSTGRRRKS